MYIPPEQEVFTQKGLKPIVEIEVGDMVLTHRAVWQPVLEKMQREVNEDLIVLETEDGVVRLTNEHPVRAYKDYRYTWIPAKNISTGDVLQVMRENEFRSDPDSVVERVSEFADNGWSKVVSVSNEFYEGTVYNLDVHEDHSYVTPAAVVHNCAEGVNQDAKFEVISRP